MHDTPAAVEVQVLGGFAVNVDGVATPAQGWARRTAAALVKVLALAPGHTLHREQVMDLLWPDQPPVLSAPRLHKAAHYARRAAGRDDAVVLRDDVVTLFPGADLTVDAVQFEERSRAAVRDADPLTARQALEWYGGELLPGDIYEEWTTDRRELLHLRRLDLLRIAGDWRELAALDPTDADAHAELMRLHVAAGDGRAVVTEYEHRRRVCERELGIEPGVAPQVGSLLRELADLQRRERAVLAQLGALGAVA